MTFDPRQRIPGTWGRGSNGAAAAPANLGSLCVRVLSQRVHILPERSPRDKDNSFSIITNEQIPCRKCCTYIIIIKIIIIQ